MARGNGGQGIQLCQVANLGQGKDLCRVDITMRTTPPFSVPVPVPVPVLIPDPVPVPIPVPVSVLAFQTRVFEASFDLFSWFLSHTVHPEGAPAQWGCQVKKLAVLGEMYIQGINHPCKPKGGQMPQWCQQDS